MKNIIIFLIILSNCALAQVSFDDIPNITNDTTLVITINDNIQPLLFDIKMEKIEYDYKKEIYPKYFIDIYNSDRSNLIQNIVDSIEYLHIDQGVKFFDINADKYLDLVIVHKLTMHRDPIYNFYLYDVSSNSFVYNEKYSDLCCYWSVDTVKNEISISYGNAITKSGETRLYKLMPDEPLLYKMTKSSSLEQYGIDSTVVREYELVNGELVMVKKYSRKSNEGW